MKKSRFTDEQITYALRQGEGGTRRRRCAGQLGFNEASFYLWKRRHGHLGLTEVWELGSCAEALAKMSPSKPSRRWLLAKVAPPVT